MPQRHRSRRDLLNSSARFALGGMLLPRALQADESARAADPSISRAALTAGGSRGDNILEALRHIEPQIRKSLGGRKQIVLKPNVVWVREQLSSTHVDCLDAILDFLGPIARQEIIIADSSAGHSVVEGYENYGYYALAKRHKVRFLDLDEEPTVLRYAADHRYRPQPVRMSKLLLDRDTYVISAAIPKTHDRAVVTLSLKNIVLGAAKKDRGFKWGKPGTGSNDKMIIHGGPANEAIHYNIFKLGRELHPHLSVIDGYAGMEGNGPVAGTRVDHGIAVASTDWLAADRIAVELMGFDFAKVGYLSFAAQAGLGQANLDRIEIAGARIVDHKRKYRPHDTIEQQYRWMTRGQAES